MLKSNLIASDPQSLNRYTYSRNAPTVLVDRSGRCYDYSIRKNTSQVDSVEGGPYSDDDTALDPLGTGAGGGDEACGEYSIVSWTAGGGGGQSSFGCNVDGADSPCSLTGTQASVACPNNICSGLGVNAQGQLHFVDFVATAGGVNGYYNLDDLTNGVNDANGHLYNDSQWQAYLAGTYAGNINGQYSRLNGNLGQFNGNAHANPDDFTVMGGHANFSFTCDDLDVCGPGRYDDGVHIECAVGGICDGDLAEPLVAHDDTVSPWTGSFSILDIFTATFWEHGFVDLLGGHTAVYVFPH